MKKQIMGTFSLDEETQEIIEKASNSGMNKSKLIRCLLVAYKENNYELSDVLDNNRAEQIIMLLSEIKSAVKPSEVVI